MEFREFSRPISFTSIGADAMEPSCCYPYIFPKSHRGGVF